MKNEQKDEIIEELWKIKGQFSSSCNKNVRQLIQLVNDIAKKQGFIDSNTTTQVRRRHEG